jgi:hypothetical protein
MLSDDMKKCLIAPIALSEETKVKAGVELLNHLDGGHIKQ